MSPPLSRYAWPKKNTRISKKALGFRAPLALMVRAERGVKTCRATP